MNKYSFTIFLIALLCLTPSLAQFRSSPKIDHYSNLNESVKAVLGAVIGNIDNISDSSDDGQTDDADEVYDLSALFAEPEEKISPRPKKIEDIFTEVFGKDNKFFEGLMEMVAVNIENLHDHANKFIDINNNDTDNGDCFSAKALENFKDFHSVVAGIIDHILDDSLKIDEDEYIVSDRNVNKPVAENSKEDEENGKENCEKEETTKDKLKNGLKTISFIKSRLAKKAHNIGHKHSHGNKSEKVLRRMNAMKPKDFEKYFSKEKANDFLNKLIE